MLARTIAATAAALVLSVAIADAAPRAHREHRAHWAEPATPPPAEAARLMAFRGVWQFDGTVTMGANKPRKVRWRLGCKEAAGGWALACDDTIHIPKAPVYRESDLFGYDVSTGQVHFFAVNNSGEARDLHGKWTDDHTLHYHYEGTRGGKPLVEDATVTLRDAGTFDLDDTVTVGGQPEMAFHGTFHLQPKRARRPRGAAETAPAAEPAQ
jgi:hypothetical protein